MELARLTGIKHISKGRIEPATKSESDNLFAEEEKNERKRGEAGPDGMPVTLSI